ncbi:hypothetical protein PUN28_001436 [Cardiocondyla obscurior]|uniref:Mid1-interacting protein 1 n=1 Tax=Cardiocondyla obscurior TaxID=286306 RepID=A0AAW2H4X3_9HYME
MYHARATSLRRIARHDEPEFSNASILNSMEKFVRTVSEMEDTILVPSRLLDLSVGDGGDTISMKGKRGSTVKDTLANTDLYRLYNIINQMKIELLWSQEPTTMADDQTMANKSHPVGSPSADLTHHHSAAVTNGRLGHVRCPSTTSMQSVQSVQSASSIAWTSDSDSENGIEIDSGLEGEECVVDLASIAAENFKRHLRGLHSSIARMTEAAEYLTLRYQADVGGQV